MVYLRRPPIWRENSFNYKTLNDGLKMSIINDGTGDKKVEINDKVDVDYTGWLQMDTYLITYLRVHLLNSGWYGQVIKRWDDGLIGMKKKVVKED